MLSSTHGKHSSGMQASTPFPVLEKYFKRGEQQSLVQDDLEAGRHVGWLLVGVIAAGSSLGILAVILMMVFG